LQYQELLKSTSSGDNTFNIEVHFVKGQMSLSSYKVQTSHYDDLGGFKWTLPQFFNYAEGALNDPGLLRTCHGRVGTEVWNYLVDENIGTVDVQISFLNTKSELEGNLVAWVVFKSGNQPGASQFGRCLLRPYHFLSGMSIQWWYVIHSWADKRRNRN
jgi:hypothetical protein